MTAHERADLFAGTAMRVYRLDERGCGVGQDRHGNLEGLHNHHRVSAGIQMSFFEMVYDPTSLWNI